MTRSRLVLVGCALLVTTLAGCGSHDTTSAPPSSSTSSSSSSSSSSTGSAAPPSSAPTAGSGSCPTDLSSLTDVASLATGDASVPPALAFGANTLYAVTPTGPDAGAQATTLDLATRHASQPTALPGAGATEALGTGDRGAVVLSDATSDKGLVASFVDAGGTLAWQLPLPDEVAGGTVHYGAEVIGDSVYLSTAAGTVLTLDVRDGKTIPTPDLPSGLVPRNVLLTGGPFLTMASREDERSGSARTVEVVDPTTGDTLSSFAGTVFFSDADQHPVGIRNDLLIEVGTGTSVNVLGSAKGFGTDVVAAAFCQKYVYTLNQQGELDMVDLGSGSTLTSTTLAGLRTDQVTVVAVPAGLVVLGTPANGASAVDIRLAAAH